MGDRPLPEGRVGPPDGIAQAPARPLAVPLRPVQRLDHRADDDRRGLQRLDGRLRGVLRALPRPAVRRGHAGVHQPREDRADRGAGRVVPPRRRPADDRRRGAAAGGRARTGTSSTSSPTPSARPTGAATTTSPSRSSARWRWSSTPIPAWVVVGRRDRRDERDDRPLRALDALPHAALRRRPGGLDLLLELDRRPVGVHRPAVADRGHRAPARRAVVPPGHRRPHDPGAGCRVDRDDAPRARAHRTQRRRLDRDQRLGRVPARRRDARARRARAASSR